MKYLEEFDAAECGGHARRYAVSLEWIEPLLLPGAVIYQTGRGFCPFDLAARRLFPIDLRSTGQSDLRYPLPLAAEIADGIFCMETIEHIDDPADCDGEMFHDAGIHNLLSECHRILKPGGWLFLTTPNANQYGCAWRLVKGDSPRWCNGHIRELGYWELLHFVRRAGFGVERIETRDVWEDLPCPTELRQAMDRLAPGVPRGHCVFMLARKRTSPNP
ncbi:MAG: methyltransferase domain-containing protein [Thermoguttaceae bacterium]|jgi:SAM-dependent methyltransferase